MNSCFVCKAPVCLSSTSSFAVPLLRCCEQDFGRISLSWSVSCRGGKYNDQACCKTISILSIMASTAAAESSQTNLVQQIQRCWNIPYGETPTKISVRVKLARDGSIQGKPEVLNASPNGPFAAAAVRAILRCAPYAAVQAHPEKYEAMRDITELCRSKEPQKHSIPPPCMGLVAADRSIQLP